MRRWFAFFVFIFLALMEVGDLVGLIPGFSQPRPYAVSVGISNEDQTVRLIILSILALSITISALVTAIGVYQQELYIHISAGLTAFLLISYGVYQILSAITQLSKNQFGVITAGIIYILLGLVASWFGSKTNSIFRSKPRKL